MSLKITDYIKINFTPSEQNPKRYILTGGPGVGKTTIIDFLEKQGESVVHEAAKAVIQAELSCGVMEPWKEIGFREKIIELQESRQKEAEITNVQRIFFDRTPIDTLTYCLFHKNEPTKELINSVQKIIDSEFYSKIVFLVENLGFCHQTTTRCEDQQESLLIHEKLKKNYTKLGFHVLPIPADSVENRVQLIKNSLDLDLYPHREPNNHGKKAMTSLVFPISGTPSSSINQEKSPTSQRKSICDEISSKIAAFQNGQGKWITPNCQHIQTDNVHYYGIHKSQQMQAQYSSESLLLTRQCYQEMKLHVLQNMKCATEPKVIQVVGSSETFSEEGTEKAKDFLRSQLGEDCLILYGYTGHAGSNRTRCVNAAVSDIILEKNLQGQAIANLVGFHTPEALKHWGCSGPELQHYVIVYGDDETSRETGTIFGDDVTTSDYFADSLLTLEGGAQSFRQACNALLLNQKIIILSGLRESSKAFAKELIEDCKESESKEILTPYFAAAQFLKEIAVLMSENEGGVSESILQNWYQNYFGQGKCYVGNPERKDFDTKQQLMDDAWNLFIREKLYLKIQSLVSYK